MVNLSNPTLVAVAAAALLVTPALSGCMGPPGDDGDDGPPDDGSDTETYLGSCPAEPTIPRDDPQGDQPSDHPTEVPGETSFEAPAETDEALALDPIVENRSTTAGGTVAFPLTVGANASDAGYESVAPEVVEADGLITRSTGAQTVGPNGTGFFLHAEVPDDAADGVHNLTVRARAGDTAGPNVTLQVEVAPAGETVDSGERVQTHYVGRFVNGTVFATSVEEIDTSSIPKASFYQGGGPYQALNVTVGPNPQFIEGFNDGLLDVGVGDNATFLVPPSKGYGNETTTGTTQRNETINRTITQKRTFNLSRQALEQQGIINSSHEQGDTVSVGQGENAQTYKLVFLNETKVNLSLQVEVGDTSTHYNQWPNSSRVEKVNATHVEYKVTPTVDLCEEFTWHDYWPNASKVVNATEDQITVQHTPDVGTNYTTSSRIPQQSGQERTVIEVAEDEIVYRQENPHPLAGKTLVFDVDVLSAEEASGQQRTRR